MIGRGVTALHWTFVQSQREPRSKEMSCDQRAMSTAMRQIYSTPATSCIDVLLAADRGVESLLGHGGELGDPRTALGVVSGRHSRMLRAVESPPRTGLGSRRVPVRHRLSGRAAAAGRVVTTPVATATQRSSEAF